MPLPFYCVGVAPLFRGAEPIAMLDVVFLLCGIVFLLLTAAYGEGCRRL